MSINGHPVGLNKVLLVAAIVFFCLAAATVTIGTIPLVPVGLACLAASFVL